MYLAPVLVGVALTGCKSGPEPQPLPPIEIRYEEAMVRDMVAEPDRQIGSILKVTWHQKLDAESAWVETKVRGEDWVATPARPMAYGTQTQLVLGLPYDKRVTWRIVNDYGYGPLYSEEMTTRTEAVPEGMPIPTLYDWDETRTLPEGNYLLGSINENGGGWNQGTYWKFIVDRQGQLVWAWKTKGDNWTIYMRVANDGTHLLWDDMTYWATFDQGRGSRVHRSYIDGSKVDVLDTPGLHHAFTEMPDGSIAYGAVVGELEELVILGVDGSQEVVWSCRDWLESIGQPIEYCQSNSLYYDVDRNTFLYSFYSHSAVLEVDRDSGEVLHYWGSIPGEWTFDPPESEFHFQHGATYTPQGTLLLSTHRSYYDYEGVVREYEVDTANKVLHQVWSSGEGAGLFSPTAGEAHRLPNGNTLHNYGATPAVHEIAPDGTVVWDLRFDRDRLIGRTVFIEDLYDLAPPVEASTPTTATTTTE